MRPTISRIAALTSRPIATPPPSVQRNAGRTLAGPGDDPTAIADSTANPTAATPSLSRLSDSTTIETRGRQPISRNEAMTDTGSVAAIRTPNKAAPIQLQPTIQCMPAATTSGGDADSQKSERQRQRQLGAKPPPVELERGFEHQRRQEHVEDQLARQRQVGAFGQQRNQETGDDQPDNIRQSEPTREHRDQAGNHQQDADRGKRNAVHCHGHIKRFARGLPCCCLFLGLGERNGIS